MYENPSQQGPYQQGPSPGQPPQPQQQPLASILPAGPNKPSPIGLGLAGAGLLLLAVGSLLPHVSYDGDSEEVAYVAGMGMAGIAGSLPGLAPALILTVLVGWTAVGIKPGLEWAAKLGGIGLAAITAAAAFHPVTAIGKLIDEAGDDAGNLEAGAGGGVWLYILAAILLAVSIFLMRYAPKPQQQMPQQYPQTQQMPPQQPGQPNPYQQQPPQQQ